MKQLQIFYSYYFVREKQLTSLIMLNETEQSKKIVESVFDELQKNTSQLDILLKTAFYDIFGTVLKVVHEIMKDVSEYFEIAKLADVAIEKCDVEAVKELCFELITITQIGITKKDHAPAIEKIIEYILANYDNPSLTVSAIADKFGIHPNYLSNIFKAHKGVTVMNYVSDVRISKSKDMLVRTRLTVEQIALQVGYTNAHTFTRAFKKLENITPTNFRKRFDDWHSREIKQARKFR